MIGLALAMMLSGANEQTRYIRAHYPAAIQPLVMRATDLASDFVNTPETPATIKARREYGVVVQQLKKRGWCWGSAKRDASEADMVWLPCRKDRSRQ